MAAASSAGYPPGPSLPTASVASPPAFSTYVPARLRRSSTNTSSNFGETNARPVCRHGSKCYRRNPKHLQEEAHPGDEDYLDSCRKHEVTPEFVSVHQLFRWCESDSGKAARDEIAKVWSQIQEHGEDIGELDDELWKEIDDDGNGCVNFGEFAEFTTRHKVNLPLGLDTLLGKRHGSLDDNLRCGVKDCPCTCFQEKRAKCRFGEKCFRANLDHKAQFCHPCDEDWSMPGSKFRDVDMCRCGHKKKMHASGFSMAAAVQYPAYWQNHAKGDDEDFNELVTTDSAMLGRLQQLVEDTYSDVTTRDRLRHSGSWQVPRDFKVVSAQRNENSKLWRKYLFKKAELERERDYERQIGDEGGIAEDLPEDLPEYTKYTDIRTTVAWKNMGAEPLEEEVNEWYLWHGTSGSAAKNICETDFKINVAGSTTGTLYGRGTYMAESITKADEYSRKEGDFCTVLLCRVLGGRVRYCDERTPDAQQLTDECLAGPFDCVLGDRVKVAGTYREFIIFDTENVFPEYIITYKRGELFKSRSHP